MHDTSKLARESIAPSPIVAIAVAVPTAILIAVVVVWRLPCLHLRQVLAALHAWRPLRQRIRSAPQDAVQQLARQAPQVQGAGTGCAAAGTSRKGGASMRRQQQRACRALEGGREGGMGLGAPWQPLRSQPQPPASSQAGRWQPAVQGYRKKGAAA